MVVATTDHADVARKGPANTGPARAWPVSRSVKRRRAAGASSIYCHGASSDRTCDVISLCYLSWNDDVEAVDCRRLLLNMHRAGFQSQPCDGQARGSWSPQAGIIVPVPHLERRTGRHPGSNKESNMSDGITLGPPDFEMIHWLAVLIVAIVALLPVF
jgi:hypothetical protein